MTRQEERVAFAHAKQHIMDAIREILADESHAILKLDNQHRPDLQEVVLKYMEDMLKG